MIASHSSAKLDVFSYGHCSCCTKIDFCKEISKYWKFAKIQIHTEYYWIFLLSFDIYYKKKKILMYFFEKKYKIFDWSHRHQFWFFCYKIEIYHKRCIREHSSQILNHLEKKIFSWKNRVKLVFWPIPADWDQMLTGSSSECSKTYPW